MITSFTHLVGTCYYNENSLILEKLALILEKLTLILEKSCLLLKFGYQKTFSKIEFFFFNQNSLILGKSLPTIY